jgi:hypothetical protein
MHKKNDCGWFGSVSCLTAAAARALHSNRKVPHSFAEAAARIFSHDSQQVLSKTTSSFP